MSLDTVSDFIRELEQHEYAIADRNGLYEEEWFSTIPMKPLVPHLMRNRVDLVPDLIDVKALDENQKILLGINFAQAQAGESGCLVSSMFDCAASWDEEVVTDHLTGRMIMSSPEGRFLLRFFDSRVFLQLRRIFPPELLYGLYNGVVKTWTAHFQGKWISFNAPEVESPRSDWRVDALQFAQINRVIVINQALASWQALREKPLADLQELDLVSEQLDRVIKVGHEEYQITDNNEDIQEFAVDSLLHGYNFYRHPVVQALLQSIKANKWSYAATMATEMDVHKWAAVESDITVSTLI